ncbi:MAG: hypothetical protein HGB12_00290 [Bacteroidetes bacterium]|nr:hypothetical protein [Bacteroidota bacterium]
MEFVSGKTWLATFSELFNIDKIEEDGTLFVSEIDKEIIAKNFSYSELHCVLNNTKIEITIRQTKI